MANLIKYFLRKETGSENLLDIPQVTLYQKDLGFDLFCVNCKDLILPITFPFSKDSGKKQSGGWTLEWRE